MHHIVSDGWSLSVFFRELTALYAAFCKKESSPLPELPIPYADFAVWQQQWLQGEIVETQLTYWKKQLANLPVLQLPTDRPHPMVQTYRGSHHLLTLPVRVVTALKTLSQREGVTLFMTLLAAFQTLLHRYTGQEDIVVGSPIANRNRAEIEGLIGFFVNTLVLRTNLSGDPSFRELLRRVREVALGAYAHQDLPFEKLVEELQPERDMSRNPLFQVMFQLFSAPGKRAQASSPTPPLLEVRKGTAILDIGFHLEESSQGLHGSVEYSTDLFEAETIARMAGHFQTLLEGIVRDPERRLSQLPLLTEGERQQLLVSWNDTSAEYCRESCIQELFEAQVERTPEAVAVVFEESQLTYRELNRRSNQVAHHLQALGVGRQSLVGICLERGVEMMIGLLGVLKAGGAYLPLDPANPRQRLAFMAEDSQASVLLTQQRLVEALPSQKVQVVRLDSDWEVIAQNSGENPTSGVRASDLACVFYTSGSTGTPKGVLACHRGFINRFCWMWKTYPFQPGETCCQKTALSFVDPVWEIFGPLLQGVRSLLLSEETLKDPARLVEALAAFQVTRLVLVPSLLRMLLELELDLAGRLPHLRYWISSGEALSVELAERFRERLPGGILINLYGSSEVSADATCYDTRQAQGLEQVPLGRPIANTQAYVLDRHRQPVPVGVIGELYIGGEGLGLGYLNRPELTAEKFLPHPFSPESGARLYKSGDLVRYLPDGNLEFRGRADHQVKIRGFRIELGEIETVLQQHPGVEASVVLIHEETPGDQRLVAYVVPCSRLEPGGASTPDLVPRLRSLLQEKLPAYMVPSVFVLLEKLPLTPNGKLDRQALPRPEGRPELQISYVAPRTPVEEKIAGAWADLLGLKQVGVHDNFFTDLGGHSLLATQLISRLRDVFQVQLSLRQLFESPTVAGLGAKIELAYWAANGRQVPLNAMERDYEEGEI